jgi:Flp pilus assembly protein TadB
MDNAVWIVIAVIATLVLIAALLWAGGRKRTSRHRAEAGARAAEAERLHTAAPARERRG